MTIKPNLAQTNSFGEITPPEPVHIGDSSIVGGPSNIPQMGVGDIRNTSIEYSNNNLAHVCDFVGELQKNIYLKKFIRWAAKAIRDGIRYVIKALGLSDRSGIFTEVANTIKALARELNYIRKTYIEPIIEFEKYVLAYITKLRAFIQYLLSLPKRFLEMLRDCLNRFLSLLSNIFTDFLQEAAAVGGDLDTIDTGFSDVVSATKDLLNEAGQTISATTEAVALGASIPVAATVGLFIPVSQEELDASNEFIQTYQTQNPTVTEVQNYTISQLTGSSSEEQKEASNNALLARPQSI